MKNASMLVLGLLFLVSCGKKASDFDSMVKEYQEVSCRLNAEATEDRTSDLVLQTELEAKYDDALYELAEAEAEKLITSWNNAIAKAESGDCN